MLLVVFKPGTKTLKGRDKIDQLGVCNVSESGVHIKWQYGNISQCQHLGKDWFNL